MTEDSARPEESEPVQGVENSNPVESEPVQTEGQPIPEESEPVQTEGQPIPEDSEPVQTKGQPIPGDSEPAQTEGQPIPRDSEPAQTEGQPIPETNEPLPPHSVQVQSSPFVEKTKEIAKNYWAFLTKVFQSPYRTSQEVTDDSPDLINGLITVILFSLFMPLFVYFYTRSVSGGWVAPTFLDTVVIPFFIFLIVIALVVAIIFAVVRLMKINIDYLAVFTRFASLIVLPTAIVLLAIVLSLINANALSFILGGFALFITFLASFASIFSIKETHYQEGGLDLIYVVLINYLAILVIFLLLGDALLGSFLSYFYIW